jgi:bacteriorhodopsin
MLLFSLQINAIGALAYLIMALGDGDGPDYMHTIDAEFPDIKRSLEWIRYAQWALTGPLTLIALGLLAGAHWVEITFVAISCVIVVGAGFAAALSTGNYATWPLFGFAVAIFLIISYNLLYTFRATAHANKEIGKLYDVLAFGSSFFYLGYVIFWGTSEGGNITNVDQEVIVYTVLDVITKVIFGFVFLFSREAIARYGSFLGGLNSGAEYDFPIKSFTAVQIPAGASIQLSLDSAKAQ